jgi:uncharacterized protein
MRRRTHRRRSAASDRIRLLRIPAQRCRVPYRSLKFHLATAAGNLVTGLGPGWVRVGTTEYRENLVLTPATVTLGWALSGFDSLAESDFANLLAHKPEVVLFGAGTTIRFPHPRLTRALADARVGLEVMDTPAACRNFNILAAEGRGVLAALLLASQV